MCGGLNKIVDVNKNLNGLCLLNKIIITLIQKIVSHITWNLKFPRLPPFMDNVFRSLVSVIYFTSPLPLVIIARTQSRAPLGAFEGAQELPMRAKALPGTQH